VREKLTRPIDTPTRQSDSCLPAKQQSIYLNYRVSTVDEHWSASGPSDTDRR